MAHEFETKLEAQDLYVLQGLTLEQVAQRTGVPERTVKEWSAAEGWVDLRKEYRQAQSEIRRQTMLYRLALLKEGMKNLHPQAAFAWATVESAAKKTDVGGQRSEVSKDLNPGEQREIKTPADVVAALQEAIERKLNRMLSQPDAVNLKAIKDLKDAMQMVDELKAKYKPETASAQQGLNEDQARFWRQQILGVQ